MNLVPQIFAILESGRAYKVLLVPKAPILMKIGRYMSPAEPATPVAPQDVRDTLSGLATMGNYQIIMGTSRASDGTFTVSTQDLGRIRVNFIIQRGTPVVFVERIPSRIPTLKDVVPDAEAFKGLLEIMESKTGIVLFTGSDTDGVADVVYAVLKHVNDNDKKVIYTVEKPLRYLLNNNKSVVIQREVKVDVETTAYGVIQSLYLEADIAYVDDIPDRETLENLIQVANRETLCLVRYPSWTPVLAVRSLHHLHASEGLFAQVLKELVMGVIHLEERGKIVLYTSQADKDALFYGD